MTEKGLRSLGVAIKVPRRTLVTKKNVGIDLPDRPPEHTAVSQSTLTAMTRSSQLSDS
ncbi:hypothetical protein J6590_024106 [Homalodisca vitripennis]|nr:hypothetical protein J6590_024106 [Homalodisca vitripennis]